MCIVLFAWQHHSEFPLLVAANRDEFHRRPAEPARWRDDVFCGLDLTAGGTWLGITRDGRFAAVTNFREPVAAQERGPLSRGALPLDFLQSDLAPQAYAEQIAKRQADFGPFNLLVGDTGNLWYLSNRGAPPQPVPPGIHGLSNGLLNTPWPKVQRGKERLGALTATRPEPDQLLTLLQDEWRPDDAELPGTGVGLPLERLVAPIFIRSLEYGTRASTAVSLDAKGAVAAVEQSWGPDGEPLGPPRDSRQLA